MADALRSLEFSDGQLIIEQGAPASCMYFVERGSARVMMRTVCFLGHSGLLHFTCFADIIIFALT